MPICKKCNRNIKITKEGVYRVHTINKDSKEPCANSGMPAPDWYHQWQQKKERDGNTYRDYLASEHWKLISEEAKRLANYRCQVCYRKGTLHAHHRTYERKGDELQSDIFVLCKECHDVFTKHIQPHRKYPAPNKAN